MVVFVSFIYFLVGLSIHLDFFFIDIRVVA